MHTFPESVLDRLADHACPSIQHRTRAELLGEPAGDGLQAEILQDPLVQDILASQTPDGWLWRGFHGYDGMEAALRILAEKAVSPQHAAFARALDALDAQQDRAIGELGNVGTVLDEGGFGGVRTMLACLLARGKRLQHPLVLAEIDKALASFEFVLGVNAIDEIVEPFKDKLVFKPEVRWPGIYHLRLLAYTHTWRSKPRGHMLAQAVSKLAGFSPIPEIHVRWKSQWIAPASFGMQNFIPDLDTLPANRWMPWFQHMELLARLGVLPQVPAYAPQIKALQAILAEGRGWFTKRLSHSYFHKWGAYTGLALERDWRAAQRRINDLTFRSWVILKEA